MSDTKIVLTEQATIRSMIRGQSHEPQIITGRSLTREVRIDGHTLEPEASQKVWNHSPDGFNWGYGGSGPAQLALALLLEAGLPEATANQLHQQFKWDIVAKLENNFTLDMATVHAWIKAHEPLTREEAQ